MSNLKEPIVHKRIWTFQKQIVDVIDSQGYYVKCWMVKSGIKRDLIQFVADLIMANGVTNEIKREVEFMLDEEPLSDFERLEVTSRILEEL
jgi:hypothetical protein